MDISPDDDIEDNGVGQIAHPSPKFGRDVFQLPKGILLKQFLGAGAYGTVCSVERAGKLYALKKIRNVFDSSTICKRTLREMRLLRLISHENIIPIVDVLEPLDASDISCLYVMFPLMEADLTSVVRSKQCISELHVKFFAWQIFRALKFLHTANIIHRDIKPSNILVNSNCDVKIADFGLARMKSSRDVSGGAMSEYVATRWYRAPEIIVGWHGYNEAVDIWASGCILGELVGKKPMFPAPDAFQQLSIISTVIGSPPTEFRNKARRRHFRYFMSTMEESLRLNDLSLVPFFANCPIQVDASFFDLLSKLLIYEPSKRLSAQDVLRHVFLDAYHDDALEACGPIIPDSVFLFDLSDDSDNMVMLEREIVAEVSYYNPTFEAKWNACKGTKKMDVVPDEKDVKPKAISRVSALMTDSRKHGTNSQPVMIVRKSAQVVPQQHDDDDGDNELEEKSRKRRSNLMSQTLDVLAEDDADLNQLTTPATSSRTDPRKSVIGKFSQIFHNMLPSHTNKVDYEITDQPS